MQKFDFIICFCFPVLIDQSGIMNFASVLLDSDSSWQYRHQSVWCADEGSWTSCCHRSFIHLLYLLNGRAQWRELQPLASCCYSSLMKNHSLICKVWKPIFLFFSYWCWISLCFKVANICCPVGDIGMLLIPFSGSTIPLK